MIFNKNNLKNTNVLMSLVCTGVCPSLNSEFLNLESLIFLEVASSFGDFEKLHPWERHTLSKTVSICDLVTMLTLHGKRYMQMAKNL